jgi:hypothetical protein
MSRKKEVRVRPAVSTVPMNVPAMAPLSCDPGLPTESSYCTCARSEKVTSATMQKRMEPMVVGA